jgi:hypothetical protein
MRMSRGRDSLLNCQLRRVGPVSGKRAEIGAEAKRTAATLDAHGGFTTRYGVDARHPWCRGLLAQDTSGGCCGPARRRATDVNWARTRTRCWRVPLQGPRACRALRSDAIPAGPTAPRGLQLGRYRRRESGHEHQRMRPPDAEAIVPGCMPDHPSSGRVRGLGRTAVRSRRAESARLLAGGFLRGRRLLPRSSGT